MFEGDDARFYSKITINGQEIEGLLESGTTVTCLGKDCMHFVANAGLNIHNYGYCIKTADGTAHKIVGRVRAQIKFNKMTNYIT